MKVSHNALQKYFETPLPSAREIADVLTFGAFEIESVEKVLNDEVIDVDVLANRSGDCLSHRGIAKELSALLDIPLSYDPLTQTREALVLTENIEVRIEDTELCRGYSAALLDGVSVGPSPQWLREYLETLGQRSINNVVDATNYVMLELGQPLHAFDADKLGIQEGTQCIVVRSAHQGEKITSLTGDEYVLDESMLVISDGVTGGALALAGIKGGKIAEVDANTKRILLESAHFNYVSVRKTSQKLKLVTDASVRFQNQPPLSLALIALNEIVEVTKKVAGGACVGIAYSGMLPEQPYFVGVSNEEVSSLLGRECTDVDIETAFRRLHISYQKVSPRAHILEGAEALLGAQYKLGASVRNDSPTIFDCSSFTAYLYAQAGVQIPRVSVDQYVFGNNVEIPREGDLVFFNSRNGKIYTETVEYKKGTPVPEGVDHVGIVGKGDMLIHASRVQGKVVSEVLSESPLYKNIVGYRSMLPVEGERFVVTVPFERRDLRIKEDLIEEIGRILGYALIPSTPLPAYAGPVVPNLHFYYTEKIRQLLIGLGFTEVYTYTLGDKGDIELANALASDKSFLRSNLREGMKGALTKNIPYTPLWGEEEVRIFEIGTVFTHEGEFLHASIGFDTLAKKKEQKAKECLEKAVSHIARHCGFELTPAIEGNIVEWSISKYIEHLPMPEHYEWGPRKEGIQYKPMSTYPFVLRDIALWAPLGTPPETVEQIIRSHGGALLHRVDMFDRFEKEDKVSFAYHLVFLSYEKTLTDSEVGEDMEHISHALTEKEWEVR